MRRILIFCALVFAMTLATATASGAQTYGGTPPVDVGGEVVTPRPGDPGDPTTSDPDGVVPGGPVVQGDVVTRRVAGDSTSRGGLPVTGGDVVALTVIGLGAIGVGTAMVAVRRRSPQTA